jgi:DNA-directed RNA polymerase sigma subunit (sigma70/sigma32)
MNRSGRITECRDPDLLKKFKPITLTDDLCEKIHEVLGELPERSQLVLKTRYGFVTGVPETLKTVSKRAKICVLTAQQIEKKCVRRIRKKLLLWIKIQELDT